MSSPNSMLCPACKVDLVMSERQNIEIDYCPKCRGVWLDRGELDKIIEKSAQSEQPPQLQARPAPAQPQYRDDRHRDERYRDERYRSHGHHRKSWLSELFD